MTPPLRPSAARPVGPSPDGEQSLRTGEAGSAAVARWDWRQVGLRARVRHWWLSRHPPTDTWTLNQRNIYILPTKGGWLFGLTLLVMLVASINYQLNLGYVLTFLLAGSGLVSMHMTHGTLRGLTLRLRPCPPVYAGSPATVEIVMSSPGSARHGVGLRFREKRHAQPDTWSDVPALGQASAHLSIVPTTRGWHMLPDLVVETRFPFGLFRAWSHWRPATQVLAYPRPEIPCPALPLAHSGPGQISQAHRSQGSEFDGVRAWRRGDSLRQVLWKKVARSGEMVSRETTAESSRELWLDWQAAHVAEGGGLEARLSRLTAWLLAAEQQGLVYGLRLPGRQFAPTQGEGHQRELLRELALWS